MRQRRARVVFGLTALAALVAAPAAAATLTAVTGGDGPPGNSRIVIAGDDGSNRRVLTAGEFAAVSPDGTRVAVVDYAYAGDAYASIRLKVLPAAGGPPTLTVPFDGFSVGWTPDGAQLLAIDRTRPERQRVLLIDPATGSEREIATGSFGGVSLSPDMTKLAYAELARGSDVVAGGGTLKVTDLASGTTSTLARHATAPLWGPRAIAYTLHGRRAGRRVYDIARIRPDGTGYKRLTRIHPTRVFLGLRPQAWSADGRRILPDVAGLEGYWLNTYTVDAVRGGARRIYRGVMATGLSRDGKVIIGQTGDASTSGFTGGKIVRLPWRGGKPRVLLRGALAASYSG
jgi:hypothetical protein